MAGYFSPNDYSSLFQGLADPTDPNSFAYYQPPPPPTPDPNGLTSGLINELNVTGSPNSPFYVAGPATPTPTTPTPGATPGAPTAFAPTFDENAYKAASDEGRAAMLQKDGLGSLVSDDFFDEDKGNDDAKQLSVINAAISKMPKAPAAPSTTPNGTPNLTSMPITVQNMPQLLQQFLDKYTRDIGDYRNTTNQTNQNINDRIDDFNQSQQKYGDSSYLPNQVTAYDRLQQALAASQGLIHTSAGSIATGQRPDTSGIAAAIGGMAQDNQNLVNKDQATQAQNFQNWLQQQVRGSQDDLNILNANDRASQLGVQAIAHIAGIQSTADLRNAMIAARNSGNTPDTPVSSATDDLAKKQAATRVALLSPGSDIQNSLAALNQSTDTLAHGTTLSNPTLAWLENLGSAAAQGVGMPQVGAFLNGTTDALKNNDVDVSRFEGAAKSLNDDIINSLTPKLHDPSPAVRAGALTDINKRIAAIGSSNVNGNAPAVVAAAPTQGNSSDPTNIQSPAGQLAGAVRDKINENITGQSTAQAAGQTTQQALQSVMGLMKQNGINVDVPTFVRGFQDAVSNGSYKNTADDMTRFAQQYNKTSSGGF